MQDVGCYRELPKSKYREGIGVHQGWYRVGIEKVQSYIGVTQEEPTRKIGVSSV